MNSTKQIIRGFLGIHISISFIKILRNYNAIEKFFDFSKYVNFEF